MKAKDGSTVSWQLLISLYLRPKGLDLSLLATTDAVNSDTEKCSSLGFWHTPLPGASSTLFIVSFFSLFYLSSSFFLKMRSQVLPLAFFSLSLYFSFLLPLANLMVPEGLSMWMIPGKTVNYWVPNHKQDTFYTSSHWFTPISCLSGEEAESQGGSKTHPRYQDHTADPC